MKKGKSVLIKVRGFHLDGYQHVNNARYLEFLEEARWEVFSETFRSGFLEERNLSFVLVNVNISYRRAALIHDELRIDTYLKNLGSRSVTCNQKVINNQTEELVADADITFVLVDNATYKAVSLTDDFINSLNSCFGE